MNKLWLITPKKNLPDARGNPWWMNYDMYHGFVICAASEQEAREIASDNGSDEKRAQPDAWLNAEYSDCVELVADDRTGIVISDYHAG